MHLRRIAISNFKSYSKVAYEFSPQINLIHGVNGVGKTNLLDAIHCLCLTKSYFNVSDRDLVRDGSSFYRLQGMFSLEEKDMEIVCKYAPYKKKVVERNGTRYERLSEHIGCIPVIMIAPDDIDLINGSNVERRKFIDNTLSQIDPDYLQNLVAYNRLVKQRNSLLKQFQKGRVFDPLLLEIYDKKMDGPAQYLYQTRKDFFRVFEEYVQHYYREIAQCSEAVEVLYQSQLEHSSIPELAREFRERDKVLGRTNGGPHKDKINLILDGREVKTFASQGQKKSLVFAMKLAQFDCIRTGSRKKPIVLLDDIFDKLDQNRVRHLLHIILKANFGQVFITDTQEDRLLMLPAEDFPIQTFDIQKYSDEQE